MSDGLSCLESAILQFHFFVKVNIWLVIQKLEEKLEGLTIFSVLIFLPNLARQGFQSEILEMRLEKLKSELFSAGQNMCGPVSILSEDRCLARKK